MANQEKLTKHMNMPLLSTSHDLYTKQEYINLVGSSLTPILRAATELDLMIL